MSTISLPTTPPSCNVEVPAHSPERDGRWFQEEEIDMQENADFLVEANGGVTRASLRLLVAEYERLADKAKKDARSLAEWGSQGMVDAARGRADGLYIAARMLCQVIGGEP